VLLKNGPNIAVIADHFGFFSFLVFGWFGTIQQRRREESQKKHTQRTLRQAHEIDLRQPGKNPSRFSIMPFETKSTRPESKGVLSFLEGSGRSPIVGQAAKEGR
jgi:hypothetical protein